MPATAADVTFGVVGDPIAHSLSPAMHQAVYRRLGLELDYEAFQVALGTLADFISAAPAELHGLSVTAPLKPEAFALCEPGDSFSVASGVANTLLFREDARPVGYNTDVPGLAGALTAAGLLSPETVLVLGGGSTAVSAALAAKEVGAAQVVFGVRRVEGSAAARSVCASIGLPSAERSLDAEELLRGVDLVISTLPGQARPDLALALAVVSSPPALFDVAYYPDPTPVTAQFRAARAKTFSGLGMLARQALVQIRIFVHGDPDAALPHEDALVTEMLAAAGF